MSYHFYEVEVSLYPDDMRVYRHEAGRYGVEKYLELIGRGGDYPVAWHLTQESVELYGRVNTVPTTPPDEPLTPANYPPIRERVRESHRNRRAR